MDKSRKATWVMALVGAALMMADAGAASVSINPSKDTFVTTGPSNNLSGNNYGAAGALGISGSSASKGLFASLLGFDLASVKSGFDTTYGAGLWTVQSVVLQLTTTSPNNAIFNAQATGQFSVVWIQNDNWGEGGGTSSSQAAAGSGVNYTTLSTYLGSNDQTLGTFTFDSSSSTTALTYTLGTASGILADIAAGNVASFELLAASNGVSYLFNSNNNTTSSNRPLLTITATPVPESSEWFALAAGCGLLALVRKVRHRHAR